MGQTFHLTAFINCISIKNTLKKVMLMKRGPVEVGRVVAVAVAV